MNIEADLDGDEEVKVNEIGCSSGGCIHGESGKLNLPSKLPIFNNKQQHYKEFRQKQRSFAEAAKSTELHSSEEKVGYFKDSPKMRQQVFEKPTAGFIDDGSKLDKRSSLAGSSQAAAWAASSGKFCHNCNKIGHTKLECVTKTVSSCGGCGRRSCNLCCTRSSYNRWRSGGWGGYTRYWGGQQRGQNQPKKVAARFYFVIQC